MYYHESYDNMDWYNYCQEDPKSMEYWTGIADQKFGDDVERIENFMENVYAVQFTDSDIDGVATGRWERVE